MQNINKSISLFTEAQVRLSIQQSTSSEIKCGYECWVQVLEKFWPYKAQTDSNYSVF